MKRLRLAAATAAGLTVALACNPAHALFHLWTFSEFFSSADGSVQFIEMVSTGSGETQAAPAEIRTTTDNNVFDFPGNLTGNTLNRRLLIATANIATLPGGVAPDFIIPADFFDSAGDRIRLFHPSVGGEFHSRTFASVPTDGVMSLHYPGPSTATNSPTNYAGTMGSVNLTPAPEPTGDYNGNGVVDAADYTTWRDTLGQSVAMDGDGADGDESGEIDAGDYTYWVERFGNVVPEGGASAHFAPGESPGAISAIVPEPATLALLLIASAGLVVNGARSRFARGGKEFSAWFT